MAGVRPRIRASNEAYRFNLYPAETSLGWRVIRRITLAQREEMVAQGKWRDVCDERGNLWGCRVLANFKTDDELPSGASSTSITVNECYLNAGLGGESLTARLSEEQRISRKSKFGKALPPEDAAERAAVKVAAWPFPASRIDDGSGQPVYGDRAVRCYPHVSRG